MTTKDMTPQYAGSSGSLYDPVPLVNQIPPNVPVKLVAPGAYSDPLGYSVRIGSNDIELYFSGYGVQTMEPGHGPPIHLEYYAGKLMLRVWADINQEDPTHTIDLSGALESNRKEG